MKNKLQIFKKGSFWMILGLVFILAGLTLVLYNLYEEKRVEKYTQDIISQMKFNETNIINDVNYVPDYIINPDIEMPVQIIDGNKYIGMLELTKLDLKLPIMSEWNYENLRKGPCRYEGSIYKDNMIIAAHNYTTNFANLNKLQYGDEIIFKDIDGNEFRYEVIEIETLKDTDIDRMTAGDWDLTLFTCTYSGAARVTVRCEKIDEENKI